MNAAEQKEFNRRVNQYEGEQNLLDITRAVREHGIPSLLLLLPVSAVVALLLHLASS